MHCLLLSQRQAGLDGFYMGVGIGRDTADFESKLITTVNNTYFNVSNTQTATENAAGTGYLGSVFAGYGMSFNQFYLAGEIGLQASFLEYENSLTHNYGDAVKTKYSIDRNISISILPGYKVTNNTLLYGRLGYVRGDFDIENSLTDYSGNTASADKRTGLNGIRYGLGVQTNLNENFGLRLEYSHIAYEAYKLSNSYQSDIFETTTNILKISPSTDQVELAAVFNFD